MTKPGREAFEALDAADPLASVAAGFLPGEPGVLYFDANSIGAMPRGAQDALTRLGDEWRRLRRRGWSDSDWLDAPQRMGDKLAPVIGAERGSVLVCDSTSINLHKMLAAALSLRPGRRAVLVEEGAFPTDNYVAANLVKDVRRVAGLDAIDAELDGDVAVLFLTHTDYRTGYRHDMAKLTKLAHERGALVLWDLSHSAGAVACDLVAADADFAVGCGYKYLCGGPGSPAWLYVAPRHQADVMPAIAGWMGHADPMAFDAGYRPAQGVRRHLAGTPPVSGNLLMEAALDLWSGFDEKQAFAKHAALGDRLIALVEGLGNTGLTLAGPRECAQRGGFVAFRHPEASKRVAALEAAGVIASYRKPDIIRFGLSPLYHRYIDLWELGQRLGRLS